MTMASHYQLQAESKGRVLVAMSGGVDSSVVAALLVEQGYQVIGATMQVWDYSQCEIDEGNGTCCSSSDVDDARAVCDRLGIPFYVINCEEEFRQAVIDPFIESYLQGETPLPCVNCNTFMKFDHLIAKMRALNCDYLATGHYAQVIENSAGQKVIRTSQDSWKDQTYFLFTLKPEIVSHLMFPIGHLDKKEVRQMAEEQGLINARKKDSVGICFVGKQGYDRFIEGQVSKERLKRGLIKHYPDGAILGEHHGIHHYTFGQRKGLGLDHHERMFVIRVDADTQTVWVGEEEHLYESEMYVERPNWLDRFEDGAEYTVKIRFQHKGSQARVYQDPKSDRLKVIFSEPQRAITPGQAAVLYRDRRLIGGGWIRKTAAKDGMST